MHAQSACSRREFLILSVMLLGVTASGSSCGPSDPVEPGGCQQPGELPQTVLDLQALLSTYFEPGDMADVRAIGQEYIERFQNDRCALVDDLAGSVRPIAHIDRVDDAIQALESAVITDFDTDRRISVGGWQLATTEVRLCALVEFLAAAPG
jgi:hypothetical protein